MKWLTFAGGLAGLMLLIGLGLHADLGAMLRALQVAGWPLLVLLPWRLIFMVLYALGWQVLLLHHDGESRAGLPYLTWVTAVREAADRLLPLPTIGGGLLGLRLLTWQGMIPAAVGASILAEMVMTVAASYLFAGLSLYLLFEVRSAGAISSTVAVAFAVSLAMPVGTFFLLRSGVVFSRLRGILGGWLPNLTEGAERLDEELWTLLRATPRLAASTVLQLLAMASGSFEVWFALRLFGHPVAVADAVIMEGLLQAVRSVAFFVPANLGTQEGGLILVGQMLGISPELSLAVSMVKRIREVAWGIPALLSWHYMEGRRARLLEPGPANK